MKLVAATRGSPLALWQTQHIASLLEPYGVAVEPLVVVTSGDKDQSAPIHQIGGKGVFAKEVQKAVLDKSADFAVHSLKDLPSLTPEGLKLVAVSSRGDPRDALVGSSLQGLPVEGHVATGSVRRKAQLAALRPDLNFHELRGNIETRLAKAENFDAIVVSAVALARLGLQPKAMEILEPEIMLPQVGQGALGIEIRTDDLETNEILLRIQNPVSRVEVDAERSFLAALGADCRSPIASYAIHKNNQIRLRSLAASDDGKIILTDDRIGDDGIELGKLAANALIENGAKSLFKG
ncbi:MAG: hydroxymethylbilane synthase [Acidimicrobiales bacterium]|nr:hydroxymethylbilane synthase [Acidimicrobiales bacterium]